MLNALIIVAGLLLLAGLLYFEKKEDTRGRLLTKTPLSLLFIVAALVQSPPDALYFRFILVGLILCLAGDVFLALTSPKAFLLGLISFLLGHVLYVFAFGRLVGPAAWWSVGTLVVFIAGAAVYVWLWPRLGPMKVPVLAYVLVISLMLSGAWAVFRFPAAGKTGPFMVLLGALLFYLSDLLVARDRFVRPEFLNRRFGLPMYYAGQFLLAFSVALIGPGA
ncbi:MAG: lysoplasmalogenase [Thermodesulfobacteriota bacterium]